MSLITEIRTLGTQGATRTLGTTNATVETDAGVAADDAATFASTLIAKLKKEYSDDSKMRPVIITFASTLIAKLKKEYSDDSKMRPVITNAETCIEKEDYRGALSVMLQERAGSEAAVDAIKEKNEQVLESGDEVEQVKRVAYVKRLYNLLKQLLPPRDEYGRTPYPTDGGEYHWGYDWDAGKERWIAYGKPSSKTGGAVHFRDCTVAEMIAELWRKGKAMGLGVLQAGTHPTVEEILECIKRGDVDYLRGKPLKTNLKTFPFISPDGYDRDQGGRGAMQVVADILSGSKAKIAKPKVGTFKEWPKRVCLDEADPELGSDPKFQKKRDEEKSRMTKAKIAKPKVGTFKEWPKKSDWYKVLYKWGVDYSISSLQSLSKAERGVISSEALYHYIVKGDKKIVVPGRCYRLEERLFDYHTKHPQTLYSELLYHALCDGMERYFIQNVKAASLGLDAKEHNFQDCNELYLLKVWYKLKLKQKSTHKCLNDLYEEAKAYERLGENDRTNLILEMFLRPDNFKPVHALFCLQSDD